MQKDSTKRCPLTPGHPSQGDSSEILSSSKCGECALHPGLRALCLQRGGRAGLRGPAPLTPVGKRRDRPGHGETGAVSKERARLEAPEGPERGVQREGIHTLPSILPGTLCW